MNVIVCRSTQQIDEDNVCELHNRLTRWLRTLRNQQCFDWRERDWKQQQIVKMERLIATVEEVINGERPLSQLNIYTTETLGIKYSSMLRY